MRRRPSHSVRVVGNVAKSDEQKPDSKMRQKILKTAIRLFAQNGFRGTRVEVIRDGRHLYDPGFGETAAALLDQMMKESRNG